MSAGATSLSQDPSDGHSLPARESEWKLLSGLLGNLLHRQAGGLVLVSGEAGIGKTTLVEALADDGRASGATVLDATAYDMDVPPPYSLWQELFQKTQQYPNLPPPPPGLTTQARLDSVSGRRELWDLATRQILDIATHAPLLLVLEDLHWADQSSIELLRYLARQIASAPILVIATYRDADLIPSLPLYHLLPHLVRELRPTRMPLRPIGLMGVQEIVSSRYPDMARAEAERLTRYLDEHAEGNPLFIEEFLGLLEETRALHMVKGAWHLGDLPEFAVPPLIRQIIEGRLQHLSPEARRALQIASIFGMDVPLSIWQSINASPDDPDARGIEEALLSDVFKETAEIDIVRFRHALVRDAIYWSTNILQRPRWHARIGEALAAGPDPDPSAVAHHFVQADDERAADWLIETAQRAGRAFALQTMITDYERALAILQTGHDRQRDRASVLCALAEAHRFTDSERALSYIRQAVELAEQIDDPAVTVLAQWVEARVRGFADQRALDGLIEAATGFESLAEEQQQQIIVSPLGWVVSDATLSQDLANYGMFEFAMERAQRFFDAHIAPTSRSQYLEFGNAYFGMGLACAALGKPERSQSAFETARYYFRESGNFQMVSNCYYWELNAVMAVYHPDQPEARHRLQREEVQANLSSEFVQTETGERQNSTSDTLILDGDWDACWRSANLRLDIPASRVPSARKLAEIEWLRGNSERAWEHIWTALPDGPDEAPGRRFFFHRQELQWVAARLAIDNADVELARQWIEAFERWIEWSGKATGQADAALLRSRWYALQGNPGEAIKSAQEALAIAAEPAQPLAIMRAHRTLGELMLSEGDGIEAGKHLDQAFRLVQICDAPYELALVRVAGLELQKRTARGKLDDEILSEARSIAERLDARPLLQRIDALAAEPAKPEAKKDVDTLGLTPRQLEVLQLLARGMTDAEIAEALFISPRTVHGHLNTIYSKLDVDSRTAAVARAYAAGVVTT